MLYIIFAIVVIVILIFYFNSEPIKKKMKSKMVKALDFESTLHNYI